MKNLQNLIKKLNKKQIGATMVEYALMLALIAIVAIAAVTFIGQETSTTFGAVGNHLKNARTAG